MRKVLTTAALLAGLAGCANPPPISTAPVPSALQTVATDLGLQGAIQTDLADGQRDLQRAAGLGIIPADDPLLVCVNSVQGFLNPPAGTAAPQKFTPRITGVASRGAVAYILAQQGKGTAVAGWSSLVPTPCKAMIGDILLKGLDAANKTALGVVTGGLLNGAPLP